MPSSRGGTPLPVGTPVVFNLHGYIKTGYTVVAIYPGEMYDAYVSSTHQPCQIRTHLRRHPLSSVPGATYAVYWSELTPVPDA